MRQGAFPMLTASLLAVACTAPSTPVAMTAETTLPEPVRAAALKARPDMTITEATPKSREGRSYYDVEGTTPDGSEVELDMLQTQAGWTVVEIQRDLAWEIVPAAVRDATAKARPGFTPVRVIESVQADGSGTIYELFIEGQPADPALEVMLKDGAARVLSERWPH